MKVAVIGTGRIGKLHLKILKSHPKVSTLFVYDPDLDLEWAKHQGIQSQNSLEELFNNSLDAVIIASPSNYHLEQIELAAKAQAAIFCEKPIGLDLKSIKKTLAIVEQNQIILQVGFNRRFDKHFAAMQKSIKESQQAVNVIKITSRDPHCPPAHYLKDSGGLFMDMAIHDFDMACYLAGSKPKSIQAFGSCTIDQNIAQYDDIDTAITTIKFENNTMAVIDNCRQANYGYDQRIEAYNNRQQWLVDNPKLNGLEVWNENGTHAAPLNNFFLERYNQAYHAQLWHFIECVYEKKQPLVTGYDGLVAVTMAQAAQRSIIENKAIMLSNGEL